MGKNNPPAPTLANWAEVDEALRLIGECENCIAEIRAEHDRREAALRAESAVQLAPYQEKAKVQEQLIKEFVQAHKGELNGKTKQLNHGKAGYRFSSRCVIPKGAEPDVIQALRDKDMLECILVKESVNRDALKQYPDEVVTAVGASLQKSDAFWCEASHEDFKA